ncbi:asparagine synthase-related protein [Sphingomonas donggukensis]|uniref:asparagine synthase (glutamine-hydrolyzing) n=1 Tax=Sphingomonas donggukensis TaxID=2949093 RepID=A0ABY4TQY1_9SPHN|nr:asparagine synthetase B family protein [Sphingomonas donggukensis]URW74647.1 asparagine synthase-related protein [Sphingomonas donggukensis]
MSFYGCVADDPHAPVAIDRGLRVVTLGHARAQRQWAGDGVRMAAADGATLATAPGGCAALLDGYIHNRADLEAALALAPGEAASDAALLLAAYRRWSDECADHVVGDYAFVLWDGARRRLLMVVEPGGMRPLFYAVRADGLAFANEPRALLTDPDVDRTIDATRVAHWLALIPPPPERSFFAGIRRVPPGGRATWQAGGTVRTGMWWHPERLPMLNLRDHRDYADAVRAALRSAVACRIGTGDERIGSHLSGGLDSGGVTALAAAVLGEQGRRLTAFTAVPARAVADPAGRFADEWAHAAAVAARHPAIDHVAVSNDDRPVMEVIAAREQAQDVPLFNLSNMVWADAIDRRARDAGVGVMLTGSMGNMTFSYDGALLTAQLLRAGRIGAALASAWAMRRHRGWPVHAVAAHLASAALPPAWERVLRRIAGMKPAEFGDYSAMHRALLDDSGLAAHPLTDGGAMRRLHPHDSRALRLAVMRRNDVQGEFATGTRRLYGIDTRDPTHDRRLTELCLSIPEEQFRHGGMPRSIARTVLADILPPMVVQEQRTGLQAADWAYGFDAAVPGLREEATRQRASRSLGRWIDLERVQRSLDGWRGPGSASVTEAVAITRALAAGRFVRRIEGGNA